MDTHLQKAPFAEDPPFVTVLGFQPLPLRHCLDGEGMPATKGLLPISLVLCGMPGLWGRGVEPPRVFVTQGMGQGGA